MQTEIADAKRAQLTAVQPAESVGILPRAANDGWKVGRSRACAGDAGEGTLKREICVR